MDGRGATVDIPRVDLRAQHKALEPELTAAVERVLSRGHFLLGPEIEAFEEEFAAYCGTADCVAVGSGTDAIRLALTALGVGSGDEVVTVAHTAVPTAFAVEATGATPVFVDVDPETYTMDPARAAEAIGPATRALLPVHLYGQCADLDPLLELARDRGLWLVEDACQAHGATYRGRRAGSLGHAGCFSFYPTKNLGGCGDGGAVVTDDDEMASRLRRLRNHGLVSGYIHEAPALNTRLDELQAAFLRVKLARLDGWNEARRHLASSYSEELRNVPVVPPRAAGWGEHVFHLYAVRAPQRDALRRDLADHGVDAGVHYPVPVHQQPFYEGRRHDLPVTERLVEELLSLPMYPELGEERTARVAGLVRSFYERA